MPFIPKSGQVVTNTGFTPKAAGFTPRSGAVVPTSEWDRVDISRPPQGFDPKAWKSMDENTKRTTARNWAKISPERQTALQPGWKEAGKRQGFGYKAMDMLKGFGQNLGAMGSEISGQGVKGISNLIGMTSDIGEMLPWSPKRTGAGDWWRKTGEQFGQQATKTGREAFPEAAESSRSMGRAVGTGASLIPGMGVASGARGLIKAGGRLPHYLPNYLPRLKSLAGIGAESAIGTGTITGAMEGRMPSLEELTAGGVIDVGLNLFGGGLGNLSRGAYSKLLGLTRGQKGVLAGKGMDLGEALSKKGYVGATRGSIAKKTKKDIVALSNRLDDLIRRAEVGDTGAIVKLGEQSGFTAKDLLKDIDVGEIFKNMRLKPKFGEIKTIKKQIQKAIDEFIETVGNRGMTLSEVQTFKKKLGNSLSGFYSKTGDAKATARELVNDMLRKNAKEIIEANVSGAKALNVEMAPLIEAKNVLQKKGDYAGYLGDLIVGSAAGAGSLAGGQDAGTIGRNLLLGIMAKRAVTTPLGRSMIGSVAGAAGRGATSIATSQATKAAGLEALRKLIYGD